MDHSKKNTSIVKSLKQATECLVGVQEILKQEIQLNQLRLNQVLQFEPHFQLLEVAKTLPFTFESAFSEFARQMERTKQNFVSILNSSPHIIRTSLNIQLQEVIKQYNYQITHARQIFPDVAYRTLIETQKSLQQSIKESIFTNLESLSELRSFLLTVTEIAGDFYPSDIRFSEDAVIIGDGEKIHIEEINRIIQDEIFTDGNKTSFIDFLSNIKALIPKFSKNYFLLILEFLLFAFAPIWANYYNETIASSNQKITRQEQKQIKYILRDHNMQKQITADMRLVTKTLYLRERRKIRSAIILEIPYRCAVKVIEKKRNWCYIEYFDIVTKEKYKGWVLNRYLIKLK